MTWRRHLLAACGAAAFGAFPALGGGTPPVSAPTAAAATERPAVPRQLVAEVVESYPHDRTAFTQGLLYFDGRLYESTGLNGSSTLRAVDPTSGTVERRLALTADLFGEGLARVDRELIQLTWRNGVALVYRLSDFGLTREHRYEGEGWGLCFDGELLIMSDGSSRLYFRDPATFDVVRTLDVSFAGRPLPRLNELECVGDRVYANVWTTHLIVEIEKLGGTVVAQIDASEVLSPAERATLGPQDVLNGIAFDSSDSTFLITGKQWPKTLRVRFVDKNKTMSR
jgi:glutaminyl-peptide cyclotransferase